MRSETEELVIPISKKKAGLITLGAWILVALSFWIWSAPEGFRFSPRFVQAVGLIAMVFFGACGIYGIVKLFDTKPGLIINAQGITDNASGASAGLIPWHEVVGMSVNEMQGQRFLTIEVTDPQKYVARGNLIKRMLSAANSKFFGSPIQISSNALQTDFDSLVEVVAENHDRYSAGA